MPFAHSSQALVDFARPEILLEFRVVNDGVMGGVSTSRLGVRTAVMVFEGVVSLENNGGFASFKGPVTPSARSAALLLTVRGDGQRYRLTLKSDDNSGTVQYQAAFVAPREWKTLRFVAADFVARFRGQPIAAPPVWFADVQYLGLVIADKQSGAFKVELKEVGAE